MGQPEVERAPTKRPRPCRARRRRATLGLQESKASERPDEALDGIRGGLGAEALLGPLAECRDTRQAVELARDEVLRRPEPEEPPRRRVLEDDRAVLPADDEIAPELGL